jgi:hypothetical protein
MIDGDEEDQCPFGDMWRQLKIPPISGISKEHPNSSVI